MEKMTVLSTNRADWPVILDLFTGSTLEIQEKKMDDLEWEFIVTDVLGGDLANLHDQLKKKTPKTICSQVYTFYKLLFTIDCDSDDLHVQLNEIGQKFQVDITIGHLSENGWHISIEDEKKNLEKIQAFLAKKVISALIY